MQYEMKDNRWNKPNWSQKERSNVHHGHRDPSSVSTNDAGCFGLNKNGTLKGAGAIMGVRFDRHYSKYLCTHPIEIEMFGGPFISDWNSCFVLIDLNTSVSFFLLFLIVHRAKPKRHPHIVCFQHRVGILALCTVVDLLNFFFHRELVFYQYI